MSADVIQLRREKLELGTSPLWRALADPTRRRVLDLLRDRPRYVGEIAAQFEISRIAIMRHLEVLTEAGLVTSRKRGRTRWYYLNAVPLQRLHERWCDPLAAGWASGLLRVQAAVEGSRVARIEPAIDVALDIVIAGTRADVFAALTEDPGGWWGRPFVFAEATGLSLEQRLGGPFLEDWDDGGAVIATVTGWAADRHLKLTGSFHLGIAVGDATFDLSDADEGTLLRFSFRAVGAIDDEVAQQYCEGWNELVGTRLKTLVETGTRLGITPDPPSAAARRRRSTRDR